MVSKTGPAVLLTCSITGLTPASLRLPQEDCISPGIRHSYPKLSVKGPVDFLLPHGAEQDRALLGGVRAGEMLTLHRQLSCPHSLPWEKMGDTVIYVSK